MRWSSKESADKAFSARFGSIIDNSLAKTRAQFFAFRMTLLEAPLVTHFTTSFINIDPNLDDFSSPSGNNNFRAFFKAKKESVSKAIGFVA